MKEKTLGADEAAKSREPEKLEYSAEEQAYLNIIRSRQKDMIIGREQKRTQFDDMTYSQWDERNIKADMSYIPPARNKGDTRIVTGTTREKDTSLVSTALSFNFSGNVVAYDKMNRIVNGLGEEVEDMVEKSRELEDYSAKKPMIYRSVFSRGTSYVMEVWSESLMVEKDLPEGYKKGAQSVEWQERVRKSMGKAETVLWDPRKVVLGNMSEFFLQKQPDILLIDIIDYSHAWELYGDWDRWKYVSKDLVRTVDDISALDTTNTSTDWTICNVEKGKVERRIYMRKGTNELAIELNGVNMLPVMKTAKKDWQGNAVVSAFPLTCISPSGEYPLAKGDYEPIEGCAISKSQPSKMRVDQEVLDESLKLMILGMKGARWPATVNNSGKILSSADFLPGKVLTDIREGEVFQLGAMQPLSSGEFSFYDLIKRGIDEKSVTAQYEGLAGQGENPTATEVLENKKQQMLKLGLALDSIVRLERDLWYLRINNILANWTKAQDHRIDKTRGGINEVYGSFTLETAPYGRKMRRRKTVRFTRDVAKIREQDPKGYAIHEAEEKAHKATGVDVRYSFIDPVALRNFKGTWYVSIIPQDKKDDTLSKMLFVQNITEAKNLFGPDATNDEKLKQRFAAVIGEDYDTFFKEVPEQVAMQLRQEAMMQGQNNAGGLKAPAPGKNSPALKTVLQR